MKRLPWLALICLFVLSGCRSPAGRLEPDAVQKIKEGTTTRREVEKKLGRPLGELNGSNHKTLVNYDYTRVQPKARVPSPGILPNHAGTLLIRTVNILYDRNQTVERITFHESTTPFHRQMSGVWVGQSIAQKDLAHLIKGASTIGDAERTFGPPMSKGLTVDGRRYMAWFHMLIQSRFELKQQQQNLFVYFDNLGIVQDYAVVGHVETGD